MGKFAAGTRVPIERSRAEIERLIIKYGAKRLAATYQDDHAMMAFDFQSHRVRFMLPAPDRTVYKRQDSYEREHRRLWRAFALVIKAQLEAVKSGVFSFEDLFLAHIVDRCTGKTFGEAATQQLLAVEPRGPLLKAAGS